MPELDIEQYAKMAPVDLEQLRRAIMAKADGRHDNLSLDELHVLAAVMCILRRRSSGPPKTKAVKPAKASKPDVMDLA